MISRCICTITARGGFSWVVVLWEADHKLHFLLMSAGERHAILLRVLPPTFTFRSSKIFLANEGIRVYGWLREATLHRILAIADGDPNLFFINMSTAHFIIVRARAIACGVFIDRMIIFGDYQVTHHLLIVHLEELIKFIWPSICPIGAVLVGGHGLLYFTIAAKV